MQQNTCSTEKYPRALRCGQGYETLWVAFKQGGLATLGHVVTSGLQFHNLHCDCATVLLHLFCNFADPKEWIEKCNEL